jgi:chaperonin GroES
VPELKLEIQMLHDRVLVQLTPEEGERRSTGGIVIPATAQMARRLAWGDVLGVGTSVRNVKVGDRVLFNPEDQLEVEVQGQTYLVMRERDLHAIASERIEHGTGLYLEGKASRGAPMAGVARRANGRAHTDHAYPW